MRLLMIRSHLWASCSLECQPDWSPAFCGPHLDSQSIANHQSAAAHSCHPAEKNHKARLRVADVAFASCNFLKVLLIQLWSSKAAKCDYWASPSRWAQTGDSLRVIYFWQLLTAVGLVSENDFASDGNVHPQTRWRRSKCEAFQVVIIHLTGI